MHEVYDLETNNKGHRSVRTQDTTKQIEASDPLSIGGKESGAY